MKKDYTHPVQECDVEDRQALEVFRLKRAKWIDWLDTDPDHAIWPTIHGLVWREVSYSTIAHVGDGYPGGALNNSLIGEAILDGHVTLQVLAIRRLVDTTKNVISLQKLLQEIRANSRLLTRENYVCFDGLPYDYARVQQEELVSYTGGARWAKTTGPGAWSAAERAHKHFDRLAGVAPKGRARTDRICLEIIDRIDQWMEESGADEITKWSHAYLAHAGSPSSRQALGDYGLKGNAIKAAIRSLACVAEAISAEILYNGGRMNALMPTAQFNPLACLERPALRPGGLEVATDHWRSECNRYDRLLSDVRKDLFQS